jgi:hypothetical protein
LFCRSIDRDTGTTSHYVAGRHAPRDTQRVAVCGTPGVESLHPVSGRNFDLTDTTLSYVAENGGHDVIYVQRFDHDAVPEPCSDKGKRASLICGWDVDFSLGPRRTLRGVPYGDTDFLLGQEFFCSTLELQFPIATFIEFPLVDLEGVLGADFGGAGHGALGVWERRVLDLVFGVNLGFAPIVLRFHFAQPINIGVKVPNAEDLTFNLSMVWRYL